MREVNCSRREIRVLECLEVTPERVGFPGARLIAHLRRRVRRHGRKSTETVYLISSLTREQLDSRGWLQLKRGYWVIESRWHQALDVSLDEDRSRVRQANAALVLGLFRRLVVSVAQPAIQAVQTPKTRWSVRRSQQQFAHRDGGPARLHALGLAPVIECSLALGAHPTKITGLCFDPFAISLCSPLWVCSRSPRSPRRAPITFSSSALTAPAPM